MPLERSRAYLMYVGANVYRLRREQGFTQDKFEELSGLDVRYLRRIERGTVNIRLETLIRLATVLQVDPEELLKKALPTSPQKGRPRVPAKDND